MHYKNEVIIDGEVKVLPKLEEDCYQFIVSSVTGFDLVELVDERITTKPRYTHIRCISEKDIELSESTKYRFYGYLDSVRYVVNNTKTVYNKVLIVTKVVKLLLDSQGELNEGDVIYAV